MFLKSLLPGFVLVTMFATGCDRICVPDEATYYVQTALQVPGREPVRTGTAEDPFLTIQQALDAADSRNLCAVHVNVGAGDYFYESLEAQLDLTIEGMGSESTRLHGPIVAEGFDLRLSKLWIKGAVGTAVTVRDSSFQGSAIRISGTQAIEGRVDSGRGLVLENVRGRLDGGDFTGNAGQSIVVTGPLSEFKATVIGVEGNSVHPLAPGAEASRYAPAVLIADDAIADLSLIAILSNPGIGLGVMNGARAYVQYLHIDDTAFFGTSTKNVAGYALYVGSDATAEIRDFELEGSNGCGVLMLEQGYVTGLDGRIHGNRYPFCVSGSAGYPANYSPSHCLAYSEVDMSGNAEAPLYDVLPVPNDPPCVPGEPCPEPQIAPCRFVPRI